MSLLDALLNEGYRDPHDVYIALRADGQKGSGTIDDPYDGGTRFGPALSASLDCDRAEFVVDANGPLPGLQVGTHVTFMGVKGPADSWFNNPDPSTFTVTEILESRVFEFGEPAHPFRCVVKSAAMPAEIPPAPPSPQFSWNGRYSIHYTIAEVETETAVALVAIRWPLAKVTTTTPHGLVNYAAVRIADISNGGFGGDYPVIVSDASPQETSFRYRLSFLPDDDQVDALPLSCTVTPIRHRFDEVMRTVPTYSVIHLGSGTFETRGTSPIYVADSSYLNVYVGYIMRAGHRLLGSGIDVSVVKLVLPLAEFYQTTAIGGNAYPLADYAEVADLTVDCNAPGHVAPYGIFPAPVTCGAVGLGGSFIRIRRVRAIHFCAQGPPECFALYINQGGIPNPPAVFDVIEDCIVEKPGENNTHETTLISIFGHAVPAGAISPIVRRNYHNCEYSNGVSSEHLALASLVRVDNYHFKITTKRPHHRTTVNNVRLNNVRKTTADGEYCGFFNDTFKVSLENSATELTCESPSLLPTWPPDASPNVEGATVGVDFFGRGALSGTGCVTEGNAIYNCRYGFYQDTGSTRDVVIRDNYCSNVSLGLDFDFNPAPPNPPDPNNPAPGGMEGPRLARTGVNLASLTYVTSPGPVYTATAVSATPHGLVNGENVNISGARVGSAPAPANTYNGVHSITKISEYAFTYTMMMNDPTANADAPTDSNPIRVGIYCLKRDANNPKIAVLDTALPHQLKVGDVVRVFGAVRNENPIQFSERTFCDIIGVLQVLSATKFTYEMNTAPSYDPDASNTLFPITFQSRYQVHRLVCERNVFDLYPLDSNSGFPPGGIGTIGYQYRQLYMFPQAVLRENLMRHIDGQPGGLLPIPTLPGYYVGSRALRIQSFDGALIEGNVADLTDPHPIHYLQSRAVTGFANQTPAGQPLPIQEDVQGGGVIGPFQNQDSLETKVQDALLFSLI